MGAAYQETRWCRRVQGLVFTYGSYMDPEILAGYGVQAGAPRTALLRGWSLTFSPHANLVPRQDSLVHGFVYAMDHDQLARLYGPEGFVTSYLPVPVVAEVGEHGEPALCYVEPAAAAAPDPDYLDGFLNLCERVGLPEAYIADIHERAHALA